MSITLVRVGPVIIRSPNFSKNVYESLFFKNASGSNPASAARSRLWLSTTAPAASVGPSVPSVAALTKRVAGHLRGFSHQRQGKLLIPASAAITFQDHSGFPSAEQTCRRPDRIARSPHLLCQSPVKERGFGGVPLDRGREDEALVSKFFRLGAACVERQDVAPDYYVPNLVENRVFMLGSLGDLSRRPISNPLSNRGRPFARETVAIKNVQRLRER